MIVKIVTDSACDVPPDIVARLGITVVPVFINVGDQSYQDGVDMSRDSFFAQLNSFPEHPSTAAPASGTFSQAYEALAAEGASHIISIHIAASLSNTFNAARLGAEAIDTVPISLVDSDQISIASGLIVILAAEAAQKGHSVAEIMAMLDQYIPKARIFGMIDNLESLRRGGRVNWAQFGLGTLLQIKPIMMIAKGKIDVAARVRTRKKAVPHLLNLVKEFEPFVSIAVLHTHAENEAIQLREQALSLFQIEEIPIMPVGPAVGAHLGLGAVGFACISQ